MKLYSLQSLRALAVSLVVYTHSIDLQMHYTVSAQQGLGYLKYFGSIGVDLFFVISGFVITLAANKYVGLKDGKNFLLKRFIRINPLYYLASLIYFIIAMTPVILFHRTNNIIESPFQKIIQTLVILPLPFLAHSYQSILIVGWTLCFEWVFYLLLFGAILTGNRYKTSILSAEIILLVLLGYVFHLEASWLDFMTSPIMLEFLLGIGLCNLYLRKYNISTASAIACLLAGISMYWAVINLGIGLGLDTGLDLPLFSRGNLQRFAEWGIPSALIVGGCVFLGQKPVFRRLWNNKWILLVGDASYSIYLTHISFFFLLAPLYHKFGYFLPPDAGIFIQLIAALLIGVGFYTWVERPFLQYARKATKASGR